MLCLCSEVTSSYCGDNPIRLCTHGHRITKETCYPELPRCSPQSLFNSLPISMSNAQQSVVEQRLSSLCKEFGFSEAAVYVATEVFHAIGQGGPQKGCELVLLACSAIDSARHRVTFSSNTSSAIDNLDFFAVRKKGKVHTLKHDTHDDGFLVLVVRSDPNRVDRWADVQREATQMLGALHLEGNAEVRENLSGLNELALSLRAEPTNRMMLSLLGRICELLELEGASFFVKDVAFPDNFYLVGTWPQAEVGNVAYSIDEGYLTSECWRLGETAIVEYEVGPRATLTDLEPVRFRDVPNPLEPERLLFVPVSVDGQTEALLRCSRCRSPRGRLTKSFNYYDILEAKTLAPLLLTWFASQRKHSRFEKRLSDISHEIGQGLMGIKACVQFVDLKRGKDGSDHGESEIGYKLGHALNIANEIAEILPALEPGKPESSTRVENEEGTQRSFAPYGDLCRPAVERYAQEIKDRGLRVEIKGADQLGRIYAKLSDFHHIMDNLITNAVKYTLPGNTIFVRLERCGADEQYHRIHVMSASLEIDETERELVFRSQYRTAKARLAHASGKGRGLAIAKQYAQKHDGDIVLNTRDGYNVFTMLLPKHLFQVQGSQWIETGN